MSSGRVTEQMEEQREDRGELAWILDRRRLNEFGFPWVFGFASCRWDHLPDQNLVEKKGKYRYEGAKQGSLVVWRKKNKTETGQIYLQFWLSWASKKNRDDLQWNHCIYNVSESV